MAYNIENAFEFIEAWQTSRNVDGVCHALGMEPETKNKRMICARATRYRSFGVPLKKFSRGYDWGELSRYAENFNTE